MCADVQSLGSDWLMVGVVHAKAMAIINHGSQALIWQPVIVFDVVAVWVGCPCYPLLSSWLLLANVAW